MDKRKIDLGIAKNYRGITLTSIVPNIYYSLLLNRIELEIHIFFRKNQNGFWRKRSRTSQIMTIQRIIEGVHTKNLAVTLSFVHFIKVFESIYREKMKQIFLTCGFPNEIIPVIMMLYKNAKAKVRSPDRDTEFLNIVADVLQVDTFSPCMLIICLDYIL